MAKKIISKFLTTITITLIVSFLPPFCKDIKATQNLFSDDFEDGNANGWTEANPNGSWQVQNGEYVGDATLTGSSLPSYSINGDQQWQNYKFETQLKSTLGIDKQVLFRVNLQQNRSYIFNFRSSYFNGGNDAILAKRSPFGTQNASLLQIVPFQNNPNQWYKVDIIVTNEQNGVRIKISIDDNQIINYFDGNNPILNGSVGFEIVPGGYQPNPAGLTTETHYAYALVSEPTSPLPLPNLKQYSPPWGNMEYDTAHIWSPGKTEISRWGCALTSASMILSYYGHTVTPDTLNAWLLANNGYIGNGIVDWSAITRFAKLSHDSAPTLPKLEYKRFDFSSSLLDSELVATRPTSIKLVRPSDNGTHFVVATGKDGSDYSINDPATTQSLLSNYPSANYKSIDTFTPSNTDLSYLYFYSSPNTTFTVTDPNGSPISQGFSLEGPYVDQTDQTINASQTLSMFALPKPGPGTYTIRLKGSGNFNATSRLYDIDANLSETTNSDTLRAGQTQTFLATAGNTNQTLKVDFDFLKNNLKTAFINKNIKNQGIYSALLGTLNASQNLYSKSKIGLAKGALELLKFEVKLDTKFIDSTYSTLLVSYINYIEDSL